MCLFYETKGNKYLKDNQTFTIKGGKIQDKNIVHVYVDGRQSCTPPALAKEGELCVLVRTVEDGLGLLRDLFAVNIPELVLTHPDWFARLTSTVLQLVSKRR